MITKDNMIPRMLVALPSFQPKWDSFLNEWKAATEDQLGDPLPLYLLLAELAGHLIKKLEDGDSVELAAAFQEIEEWQVDGDSYVYEAAVVGVLEDLQNTHLHRSTTPDQFERFLGARSKISWAELNSFWGGKAK